jgi:HD superfamily phosphohydrolase
LKNAKNKIINDPVWGFIDLKSGLLLDLIEHPYFQRLRRIKQLGLSSMVYPGANHTRFEHAIGTMHLVSLALDVLKEKGNKITDEEAEGAMAALLLHDIGHGPFSHALEQSIVQKISHEEISCLYMDELNAEMNGRLSLAIQIFLDQYPKHFLHRLVSSQLDMDRLDFLMRDSFYSGVSEGVVSSDRIIKMLNVRNDELVVEAKGIYSVEKFLIARRLMYWQVYLHKTVVAADNMMVNLLHRASELVKSGIEVHATRNLEVFLNRHITGNDFLSDDPAQRRLALGYFAQLDDSDIICSVKQWINHPDRVLSLLSSSIINRKLYKIKLSQKPVSENRLAKLKEQTINNLGISSDEVEYFLFTGIITNSAYSAEGENIMILYRNGKLKDISEASDINLEGLTKSVRKHFVCYPDKTISG